MAIHTPAPSIQHSSLQNYGSGQLIPLPGSRVVQGPGITPEHLGYTGARYLHEQERIEGAVGHRMVRALGSAIGITFVAEDGGVSFVPDQPDRHISRATAVLCGQIISRQLAS
ncbi:MAG: hypothetical protein WAS36_01290 [Candidatus Saccharimonadales bacterium]